MIRNIKLLKELLGKKKWIWFKVLLIASFVASLLEGVGISLIFPAITMLLTPDFIAEKWKMVLILIGSCYLLKNIYLLMLNYIKNHYVLRFQFELKKKVLEGFFYAPYMKYIHYDTAELVQAVETDVDGCVMLLEKVMGICCEGLMLVILIGMMVWVNIKVTVVVLLLCVSLFLLLNRFLKPYSIQKSEEYTLARKEFHKWLYQSMGNRKEIKAEQKEYFFMQNFHVFSERAAEVDYKVRFMQSVPRFLYEVVFVGCLVGVLLFYINTDVDFANAVAQLSVFGVAALRMMPSMLKLNQLLSSIFWNAARAERTVACLKEQKDFREQAAHTGMLPFQQELKADHISFSYPQSEEIIFEDASFTVPAGKLTGISGLSGAGKTTLIDIIAGLLTVSKGDIFVDGISVKAEENLTAWQAGVAYIPQNACLLHANVRENILFGSDSRGDEAIWEVLELTAASEFVKKLPEGLDTIVGENGCRLSGGQAQRLVLARALYKKAQLVILDETTSALDAETEQVILEALQQVCHTCTVILVSHRASALDKCDVVYRIEGHKIHKVR